MAFKIQLSSLERLDAPHSTVRFASQTLEIIIILVTIKHVQTIQTLYGHQSVLAASGLNPEAARWAQKTTFTCAEVNIVINNLRIP